MFIGVGDTVICIDDGGIRDITMGKEYKVISVTGVLITVLDDVNDEQVCDVSRFKKEKFIDIETTDYSNYKSNNVEKTNTDIPVPEKVKDVSITVDNGRIYVTINGVEVYSNMSLHDGNVTINC